LIVFGTYTLEQFIDNAALVNVCTLLHAHMQRSSMMRTA